MDSAPGIDFASLCRQSLRLLLLHLYVGKVSTFLSLLAAMVRATRHVLIAHGEHHTFADETITVWGLHVMALVRDHFESDLSCAWGD